jgi:hypothetical protein
MRPSLHSTTIYFTSLRFTSLMQPRREAEHSPPSRAEIKNRQDIYLHTPIHLYGVVLNKHKENSVSYQQADWNSDRLLQGLAPGWTAKE